MRSSDVPTVVCCRKGGDEYVLLTHDLEGVHAWGDRSRMLQLGIQPDALDVADRSGSVRLTDPPEPGHYPWSMTDIQDGDWFIDRARAMEYVASRRDVGDPEVSEFALEATSFEEDSAG